MPSDANPAIRTRLSEKLDGISAADLGILFEESRSSSPAPPPRS